MKAAEPPKPVQKSLFAFEGATTYFKIFKGSLEALTEKQDVVKNMADYIKAKVLF